MAPEVMVMSVKAWDSLDEQDRRMFREAARESNMFMRRRWQMLEDESRKRAEASGVMIIRGIDRKPFEAAMAPLYAKAEADPAMARLIARIRQVQ